MGGTPPDRLRPRLGFRPKTPLLQAGSRIEPPPSLACAAGLMPAATAAPAPPDEPAGVRARFQGLRVAPNSTGSVVSIRPNSGVLVRPTVIRPAASRARA